MPQDLRRIVALLLLLLPWTAAGAADLDTRFDSFAPYAVENPQDESGGPCVTWEDRGPRLVPASEQDCALRSEAGACRDIAYEGRFTNVCPVSMDVTWKWQDRYDQASLWTLAPGESRWVSCQKKQDGCSGALVYRWSSR